MWEALFVALLTVGTYFLAHEKVCRTYSMLAHTREHDQGSESRAVVRKKTRTANQTLKLYGFEYFFSVYRYVINLVLFSRMCQSGVQYDKTVYVGGRNTSSRKIVRVGGCSRASALQHVEANVARRRFASGREPIADFAGAESRLELVLFCPSQVTIHLAPVLNNSRIP
jgi:hypothetical protein